MTDLDKLIEAVEMGDWDSHFSARDLGMTGDYDGLPVISKLINAYQGSLDAAKALHDALLPGWEWRLRENMAWVWRTATDLHGGEEIEDDEGNGLPARAWLLSILKAYRWTKQ